MFTYLLKLAYLFLLVFDKIEGGGTDDNYSFIFANSPPLPSLTVLLNVSRELF